MNMHEWMMQSGAPQRPNRPQFDKEAYRALDGQDAMQGYRQDFRGQIGDWRDSLQGWRGDMRDYRQDGRDQMGGPVMTPSGGGGNGPIPGQPAQMPNTQFPLNPQAPQPIPGSGYGFNLADILQRFPNGLGRGMHSQPGLNPGY